jgi:hypothetical protein
MEKEEKSRGKKIDGCCIVFTCQTNATAWHGDWMGMAPLIHAENGN